MTHPDDETTFESEVRAMLHRRSDDIRPDAMSAELPDADAPLYDAGLPARPARRRHALLAVACIMLLLGLGVFVAGGSGSSDGSVTADRASTVPETTDPVADDDAIEDRSQAKAVPDPDASADASAVSPATTEAQEPVPAGTEDASDTGTPTGAETGGGYPSTDPGPPPAPATPGTGPGGPQSTPPSRPVVSITNAADHIFPNWEAGVPRTVSRNCERDMLVPSDVLTWTVRRTGPADAPLTFSLDVDGIAPESVKLYSSNAASISGLTVEFPWWRNEIFLTVAITDLRAADVTITPNLPEGYDAEGISFSLPAAEMLEGC